MMLQERLRPTKPHVLMCSKVQGGYNVAVLLSVGTFIAACRCLLYSAAAPAAWIHFAGAAHLMHVATLAGTSGLAWLLKQHHVMSVAVKHTATAALLTAVRHLCLYVQLSNMPMARPPHLSVCPLP